MRIITVFFIKKNTPWFIYMHNGFFYSAFLGIEGLNQFFLIIAIRLSESIDIVLLLVARVNMHVCMYVC